MGEMIDKDPLKCILMKCEQYWNEHNICDEEVHASLETIHRWASDAQQENERLTGMFDALTSLYENRVKEVERLREALDYVESQALAIQDGVRLKVWPTDQSPIVLLAVGIAQRARAALAAKD